MANVINKTTGQYLKSVHTPDYSSNSDWIINPTQAEITTYTPDPPAPRLPTVHIDTKELIDTLITTGVITKANLKTNLKTRYNNSL